MYHNGKQSIRFNISPGVRGYLPTVAYTRGSTRKGYLFLDWSVWSIRHGVTGFSRDRLVAVCKIGNGPCQISPMICFTFFHSYCTNNYDIKQAIAEKRAEQNNSSCCCCCYVIRELKQRRRRWRRERQKSNRFGLAKQQLCTCITLFCTFFCRRRATITTWNVLISVMFYVERELLATIWFSFSFSNFRNRSLEFNTRKIRQYFDKLN